ncbi:hypothetical protein HKX48_003813 [Thoreauomyces humboldtii]|nr:hypothetical protein HKX48_003813 [Thoreauomyces humboldtii]
MTITPRAVGAAILIFCVVSVWAAEPAEEKAFNLFSYSLTAPYVEENLQNKWFDFNGDTYLEVNNYVRLTSEKRSQRGNLWSKSPLTATSWMVDFEFKVHGSSAGLHGDGFAFWYTTRKNTVGPVFGSEDKFGGLGVFFDTYANGGNKHSFPRINAMIGDEVQKYDHDNDGQAWEVGSCQAEFRNREHSTKGRVRYVRETKTLSVFHSLKGSDAPEDWKLCFEAKTVNLPTSGYLGFSAHTGDVSDMHDIISVKTQGISFSGKPPGSQSGEVDDSVKKVSSDSAGSGAPVAASVGKGDSTGGGLIWSFVKFMLAIAIIAAVCYGAWMYAQRNQDRSFKRF